VRVAQALFSRLVPADKSGVRRFSPIQKRRLAKLGIQKVTTPHTGQNTSNKHSTMITSRTGQYRQPAVERGDPPRLASPPCILLTDPTYRCHCAAPSRPAVSADDVMLSPVVPRAAGEPGGSDARGGGAVRAAGPGPRHHHLAARTRHMRPTPAEVPREKTSASPSLLIVIVILVAIVIVVTESLSLS
jgi:hypothetical protein